MSTPLLIAHRGNTQDFPENTLEAFRSAFKLGADGIELDVQLNDDRQLIVVHDYLHDKNKYYPLLEDVLREFGQKGRIEIEIKSSEKETPQLVAALIQKHPVPDLEVTTSIVPLLPFIRKEFPKVLVGFIFRRSLIEDWMTPNFISYWILKHLELAGANVLHLDVDLYTEKLVTDLKGHGIVLHTHLKTADQSMWQRVCSLGIDQCTFDNPAILKAL